jgi:hypothetical protein
MDILFSSLGKAQDVIQVHDTYSVVDPFSEDIIDHVLEGARGVAESEEHDQRFEESSISPECHLPFFSFCHPDILKAPSQVQFPKHFGSSESVDDVVGGRNPCSVESSFDVELSGKRILIVTIWHLNNKSLFCSKTILFFYMSGDILLEDSSSL